ncbi:MAG: S9 family peptidase [Acidobacteriota bacterium]|nr:MAG: S9 family peptidase [Acidobacteriota bacterium]
MRVLAVAFSLAVVSPLLADETHPFSVHDMLAMDRISDAQVSPDGQLVVFVRRTTDLEANKGRTDLWLVGTDGEGLRRLTSHEASESNPRFSPDAATVYFLSSRSGSPQVWKIRIDGGEAEQVFDEPLDVTSLALSPDGTRIAYSMDVFVDCETPQCTRDRLDEKAKSKRTGLVYERLFVRHWDSWKDGRRSHVFVRSLEGGEGTDVMKGVDADCPSKPFGGPEEYTFTPDGRGVVFTARDAGREEAWSTDFDLYVVPIDLSAPPRCLTEANEAWDTHPVFSPDGQTLAYLAMERAGYESDRLRIVLRGWGSGETRVVTEDWDRSARSIVFSPDASTIYTHADNLGQRSLFAIDVASGEARTIVEQGTVRSIGWADGRLIVGLDHLRSPVELYSVQLDGSDFRSVTQINGEKLAAARMGEPEQFIFQGWNDEVVYAYVVKPVDFDPAQRYPVAFLIHGGPQGSFGNDFHYRWNPQAYAGAGYAAVMGDFHGSTGYGQAFTDSIRDDWGGKPLVDLQAGLAAALERYPWMDGSRVAALGASFGGYMINWIAGQWPDRFRCLVSHDGNIDEQMAYYDTEELWFPEWERGGTPWENPEAYQKHNPINHVDKWQTPMLVVHGALDYRVVDTQGISSFTALQRRGIPSKLLYFPDENHWVLKPHNSIQWHETVIGWLDQWTR